MILDIFQDDAFGVIELSTAIETLPHVPTQVERMGIFQREALTQKTAAIEYTAGRLGLVATRARGTMNQTPKADTKTLRVFSVPHLPIEDVVMADDVAGIRSFGSEDQMEAVGNLVAKKLQRLKQYLSVTLEYHRVGALSGNILDADGSTSIYNLFTEFGISETEYEFDFTTTTAKQQCLEIVRLIEAQLGASPYTGVMALCGNEFFDAFIAMDDVREAYAIAQNGEFFRTQQAQVGGNEAVFFFGGIGFINYRGSVGSINFIATDEARFFPVGVPDLFLEFNAPAPFMETVNTPGQQFYAKQERQRWDTGVDLHVETNTLFMCTRPAVLIKGTMPE